MAEQETQFGKYTLLAKIAAGGMAVAYRAEMTGAAGVKKRVVLKVIHAHLAQEKNFKEMFISEARLAATLTHQNIAQIFDFGEVDGRYYLSMEEVVGQPLSKVLKVGRERGFARLPVPLALQIIIGVCDGLHYAHTRKDPAGKPLNLVHRDVTPDNVLISYEGEVKVVDFGIAKTTESTDQTEAGMVRGKYPYLSPEQAGGKRDLDARTDIWAAGIQLFDMLCGRRPYEGEFLPVMREIVGSAPVLSPRSLVAGMDPELEKILMGALRKNRADRYATARDFSLAATSYLHQNFPSSTRQELQFLLATLFGAEAKKEGADVGVPRTFSSELALANAPSANPAEMSWALPSLPPVPTGNLPPASRITEETSTRGVLKPASASGPGPNEATRGPPEVDDEATIGMLPSKKDPLPPPVVTRTGPAEDNDERTQMEEPKPRLPPKAPTMTMPEAPPRKFTVVDLEPSLVEVPKPKPKPNATVERNLAASEALQRDMGRASQRQSLLVGGFSLVIAVLGLAAFFSFRSLNSTPEASTSGLVQLWITSLPSGATLKVDGLVGGKTPSSANVLPGEHSVELSLPGYAVWTTKVHVKAAGENVNIDADLELIGNVDGGTASPLAEEPMQLPTPMLPTGPDDAHLAKWPSGFNTLRLGKMALPLESYTPLRLELNPKTTYAFSTLGTLNLGKGRSTQSVLYYLDGELPQGSRMGLIGPTPKAIKGAKGIRVFAIDDTADDNSGSLQVVSRISQYVPERVVPFDSRRNVIVPRESHQFVLTGMSSETEYLVSSRGDMPSVTSGKLGKVTQFLCLSLSKRAAPLSRSAHFITLGSRITIAETSTLQCLIPDDVTEDNGGNISLQLTDAAKAADEGVDPTTYTPAGK